MSNDTDILGTPLTENERKVLAAYETLKGLLELDDLSPSTSAGIRESIASLWQVVNNLGLTDDRPGV